MKKTTQIISIILFFSIILTPIFFFNFKPDTISEIDNRKLAENPFTQEGSLTTNIGNYISDRIGFRNEMISAYAIFNDKLFNKMVHPTYSYGKDGYVFGAGMTTKGLFSDYHIAFADMVLEIQNYCEDRDIPFIFVFNPAKPAILTEYIPTEKNYSRDWVDKFMKELDARNINYIDNTVTLKNATNNGKAVFNQKYDANHWNSLGAFYGTNAILEKMKEVLPNTHINQLNEFNVSEKVEKYLPVSKFPIDEKVYTYSIKNNVTSTTDSYNKLLEIDQSYSAFGVYTNEKRKNEGAPSALVFQGSYMNGYGLPFMMNALGEYVYVHDYQNIMNLPYYINIFKPECVVFEVAEYTFSEQYFSLEKMKNIDYNQTISAYKNIEPHNKVLQRSAIDIESVDSLTKITWNTDISCEYLWLQTDEEFDMRKSNNGYEVTIKTEQYEKNKNSFKIYAYEKGSLICYS